MLTKKITIYFNKKLLYSSLLYSNKTTNKLNFFNTATLKKSFSVSSSNPLDKEKEKKENIISNNENIISNKEDITINSNLESIKNSTLLVRLDYILKNYPGLSFLSFFLVENTALLTSLGILKYSGVIISPDFITATILAKSSLVLLQYPLLAIITPIIAKLIPVLTEIKTGSAMVQLSKNVNSNLWGKGKETDPLKYVPPTRIQLLMDKYGAASYVSMRFIHISTRLLFLALIMMEFDLSSYYDQIPESIKLATTVASYVSAAAVMSSIWVPINLISPALLVPRILSLKNKFDLTKIFMPKKNL